MTEFEYTMNLSPADMQGEPPYDEEELETLRREAWNRQGVFIIDIREADLSEAERSELARIANALYGKEGHDE